jgi:threonine/homoserine/homoserine lactone efflux protein
MFVLASALTGGRSAGMAATAGIMAGGAVHAFYGALGIGLLASFLPWLFNPLLIAGALYMAWIGFGLIRSSIAVGEGGPDGSRSRWRAFRRGALTCLMNPKAYLFMLAVYPQFLKPAYGPIWLQGLIMGLMTVCTQFAIYGTLAVTAGRSRAFLVSNPGATVIVGRVAGLLLILVSLFGLWHGLRAA